jgi:hypothetical protein
MAPAVSATIAVPEIRVQAVRQAARLVVPLDALEPVEVLAHDSE